MTYKRAGILQQDFAAWAKERGTVLPNGWVNGWADAMQALGYQKQRRAYVAYLGIVLKGAPALQVVK